MQQRKRSKLVEAGITVGLIFALFCAMTNLPVIPVIEEGRLVLREATLPALGADIGGGASCVVNVSLVKHGLYDYTQNITRNNSMFAWGETNDTEIGVDVPFDIYFDIVVKVAWNRTHMYNTSNSNWTWEFVNSTIAITLLGYTAGYPGSGGHGFNISSEWNISEAGWSATNERTWAHYVFGGGQHSGTGGAAAAGGNDNGLRINRSQRIPTVYFRFFAYY